MARPRVHLPPTERRGRARSGIQSLSSFSVSRPVISAERQISDLTFPFIWLAAFADEQDILHTNNIERRIAAEQRPKDVVVEVLVREPAQWLRATPREQPITDAVRRPVRLAVFPRAARGTAALGQVSVDFRGMAQAIRDHLIDVGQRDRGILLHDLLCCSALPKCGKDGVERNSRTPHSHDTICVLYERNRLCRRFGHVFRLPLRGRSVRRSSRYRERVCVNGGFAGSTTGPVIYSGIRASLAN